jgi:hypothetical protein
VQSDPSIAETARMEATPYGRGEMILQRSRERYATPRSLVERRINRWMRGE